MPTREQVLAWLNALEGRTVLVNGEIAAEIVERAWSPIGDGSGDKWLAMRIRVLPQGPARRVMPLEAVIDWSGLRDQIGIPQGVNIRGFDRGRVSDLELDVVLRF